MTTYSDRQIIDGVLEEFAVVCSVAHPSGHENALAALLEKRLISRGLTVHRDAAGNLWADLPASPECADAPLIALQAHLDMVPVSGAADYDPLRDPVRFVEQDGWLSTGGRSTLGADCGAGLAVMLWLTARTSLPHPRLRLIMTVGEETGLTGARALDPAALADVRELINLDGFADDLLIAGAAGGLRERFSRPFGWTAPPAGQAWRLTVRGLTGGHSGYDIAKSRANANVLMAALLERLDAVRPVALFGFEGGTAFNAIPTACTADVVADGPVEAICARFSADMAAPYHETDPKGCVIAEPLPLPAQVWRAEDSRALLSLLEGLSDGVLHWQERETGLPSLSSNLGRVYAAGNVLYTDVMVRAVDADAQDAVHTARCALAERCGFDTAVYGSYPAWPLSAENTLVRGLDRCFHRVGRRMTVGAEHVGLEVSLLREKNPQMRCVSLGMRLEDCHSTAERWRLDTIPPLVRALTAYLAGE